MLRIEIILAIFFSSVIVPTAFATSYEVIISDGSSVPGCEPDRCYLPFEKQIQKGDTIIWKNQDTAAHTVTSGTGADGPDGNFDSSLFLAGTTFSHTFEEDGSFDYFCIVHPWMKGRILVGDWKKTELKQEPQSKPQESKSLPKSEPQSSSFLNAVNYIEAQEKLDPYKNVYYYIYRTANEKIFADWWNKYFPNVEAKDLLKHFTGRTLNWELNCEKAGQVYVPNGLGQPICEDPFSFFKRVLNFPNPELTKQDYYDRYNNSPAWKSWFDHNLAKYGTLDDFIKNLEDVKIPPPTTRIIGYNINSECELSYAINYNLHYKVFGSAPLKYDKEKIANLGIDFQEELKQELLKKYEQWEIEAGLIPEDELKDAMMSSLNNAYGKMTEVVMKDNSINPKLKENVMAIFAFPGFDEQTQLKALYTKSLLHPDQYGKDIPCEKKYHEYFRDSVFQDLKLMYGEDRAQIVFDEIKKRIYEE